MSKIGQFTLELSEIKALQESLSIHLEQAQSTLSRLIVKREKAIRLANGGNWDKTQYTLDDVEQELSNVSEKLDELSIIPDELKRFLEA